MSPPLNFTEAILDPVVSNFSSFNFLFFHIINTSDKTHSGSGKNSATVHDSTMISKRKLLTGDVTENRDLHRVYVGKPE